MYSDICTDFKEDIVCKVGQLVLYDAVVENNQTVLEINSKRMQEAKARHRAKTSQQIKNRKPKQRHRAKN